MSMNLRIEDPYLLVVRFDGRLRRAEFDESQRAAATMIRQAGKISALILLDRFQGWERRNNWGEVGFRTEHDSDIEKLAIVGDDKWRDDVLVFAAAGLRRSPVRYFNDEAGARAWLAGGPS